MESEGDERQKANQREKNRETERRIKDAEYKINLALGIRELAEQNGNRTAAVKAEQLLAKQHLLMHTDVAIQKLMAAKKEEERIERQKDQAKLVEQQKEKERKLIQQQENEWKQFQELHNEKESKQIAQDKILASVMGKYNGNKSQQEPPVKVTTNESKPFNSKPLVKSKDEKKVSTFKNTEKENKPLKRRAAQTSGSSSGGPMVALIILVVLSVVIILFREELYLLIEEQLKLLNK